jgi:hypothetical protein
MCRNLTWEWGSGVTGHRLYQHLAPEQGSPRLPSPRAPPPPHLPRGSAPVSELLRCTPVKEPKVGLLGSCCWACVKLTVLSIGILITHESSLQCCRHQQGATRHTDGRPGGSHVAPRLRYRSERRFASATAAAFKQREKKEPDVTAHMLPHTYGNNQAPSSPLCLCSSSAVSQPAVVRSACQPQQLNFNCIHCTK